jgi:hypothetical protein
MCARFAFALALIILQGGGVLAQNWTNPAGGSWGDSGNWNGGALPTTPTFNLASSSGYTVTLPASYSLSSLTVQTDNTTLALNGYTLTTPTLNVATVAGQNGILTLLGPGAINCTNVSTGGAGFAQVGTTGATGQLIVNDATIYNEGEYEPNLFTVNGLTVENGGNIDVTALGSESITNGTFNDGSFQASSTSTPLALNQVQLTNSSSVKGFEVTVGNATLDNSTISASDALTVSGTVTVSDNGELSFIGTTVSGTVYLLSGGKIVSSNMMMNGGTISIQLNGQVSQPIFRPISMNNGTLDFTLQNGFEATLGEVFNVMNVSYSAFLPPNERGTFAMVNLPALPAGESWDTDGLYTTGDISVVPEPMSFGILATGLISLSLGPRGRFADRTRFLTRNWT